MIYQLSEKEKDIIDLLARGKTQKEIARDLFMSIGTVEAKTAALRRRFDCVNSTELVAKYKENLMATVSQEH